MPISIARRLGGSNLAKAVMPYARAVLLLAVCLALALALSQLTVRLLRDPQLQTAVWWPMAGLGVAVLARLRPRDWPVALAGFAAGLYLTNVGTYAPLIAAGLVTANCSELLLIAVLARRLFPHGVLLDSPRQALRFILCAAAGVTLGATGFALVQAQTPDADPLQLWHGYFRTHALGLLLISPLLLVFPRSGHLLAETRRTRLNLEWAAQFTAVGLLTAAVFGIHQSVVPTFVCGIPLLWGGMRLGPLRSMVSLLLMALITTIGTLRGVGPIVQEPAAAQTLAVQLLLTAATVCTLFVVLTAEAKTALLELTRAGRADLTEAERIAGLGSSTWDIRTGETRWSEGLYAQLGQTPDSLPASAENYLSVVHPEDRGVMTGVLARLSETSTAVPNMEVRLLRPDGTERIVMVRNRIDHAPDGRPIRLRSTVLDVTTTRKAESELLRAHARLSGVMDAVEDVAIIGVDPASLLITFFSKGAENILGWRAEEVVGVHTPAVYHHPGDLERAVAETGVQNPLLAMGDAMLRTGHSSARWTCLRKNGSQFFAQGALSQVLAPDGQVETYLAVVVDLTRVLRAEADLQESEDRFRLAFDFAPMAMAIVALDEADPGRIQRANPALCRFADRSEADLVGQHLADLMTPAHAEESAAALRRLLDDGGDSITGERAFHRADGEEQWGLLSTSVVRPADGAPYLITMIEDITARMRLTERLRHEASHDPLTGLPNRQVLRRRLEDALTEPPTSGPVAVLYVDLDGFKAVNDSRGHAVGDELLVQVAGRISGCVRSSDVVARLGGDEFAVLLPRVGDLATAQAIGERIVATLAEEFVIRLEGRDVPCRIGASVGIALSTPEDTGAGAGTGGPQLLHAADEAMYQAKREGKGRVEVSAR